MSTYRVVIVEDNALVAEDCRSSLERYGFDVVAVTASGEEAVIAAEQYRPDVMLMDIRLSGGIDGIQAAEQIIQQFEVPVLFLSAFSDTELVDRASRTGAFGFLIKPYKEIELRAMLETVISKARTEREYRRALEHIYELGKVESLGRMAGAVAHHYNNKMAVILGGIELAMKELPPESPAAEMLGTVNQTVQATIQLGRQMLSSLGETFKPRYTLDLSTICKQAATNWEQRLRAARLDLKLDIEEKPYRIWANAEEILEIISAVMENAVESMEDKSGTLDLRLHYLPGTHIPEIHRFPGNFSPEPKLYACIEIQDQGTGIRREDIHSLFDPFFTTKFTGRGMGLPVTLGLVRAHNGCITLSTTPPSGSCFQIWIPVHLT